MRRKRRKLTLDAYRVTPARSNGRFVPGVRRRYLRASEDAPAYVSAHLYEVDVVRWLIAAARIAVEIPADVPVEDIQVFAPIGAEREAGQDRLRTGHEPR